MQPTDVHAIVKQAMRDFEGLRERQSVQFSLELPDHLPPVSAEAASVSDALLNLLTNAIKYGGHPAVIALRVTATPRHVRIAVQDNGLGIAAREHKRIFQKFYRVDDRLSRDKEGSGLGLAIAKHVVKAHRGHIELHSAPGKGSVFTIVLPASSAAEAPVLEAKAGRA
jgi:two-component system phosphate regulon sensor histidine kinase PhoR